jgi:hydroxypyruvate reductase
VRVISAGKAAAVMATTAAGFFGPRISEMLVATNRPVELDPPVEVIVGGHPVPTVDSERAGRRALTVASATASGETLLVLLSGGASALLAVPAAGVSLEAKRAVTAQLLRGGADITAFNTVRKHLSAIKGGRLAAAAGGRVETYALSDVIGDDLAVIGSGPTVSDPTTFAEALDIVRRFGDESAYPPGTLAHLQRGAAGEIEETIKPGDPRLARTSAHVIGNRHDAAAGAAAEAERRGYTVTTIPEPLTGEARDGAVPYLARVRRLAHDAPRPFCAISTGETTVTVRGKGRGGRNQEFVLAAADALTRESFRLGSSPFILASAGTDGIDGPTDAAGAVADSTTAARAASLGLAPRPFLDDNNAYAFFLAMGDLIHTGPTDTNVGDLQVVLVA